MNHQDWEQGQQGSEVLPLEPEVLPDLVQVQEQVLLLEQGLAALRFEAAQAEELVQVLLRGVEQGQEQALEPQEHLAEVIELASVRRQVRG